MLKRFGVIIAALAVVAAPMTSQAIGDGTGFKTGSCELGNAIAPGSSGSVLQVGAGKQYTTIQSAVDDANEGDHIVIFPGTYKEAVQVATPGLRITGTDRDQVILDGESSKAFGFFVQADRVVIENMTGHNYTNTIFYWLSSTGYWARYITAYNAGLYGIYAYDSRCGQIDNSYASGGADSGFYIGECYPCDAVITRVEAAENGLGYSGTNAGGNLLIKDSWWHDNALGIVPNSLDGEAAPPQRGLTIENNLIENNSGIDVPGRGPGEDFYGVGIAIAGGQGNHIIGNTLTGHALVGIVLAPLATDTSLLYIPGGNTIWGNTVTGSGLADLAQGATSGPNNCWGLNTYDTTAPPLIETIWGCTNIDPDALPYNPGPTPPGGDPRVEQGFVEGIAGLNGRAPSPWQTWDPPTCASAPASCTDLPDENGDSSYINDADPDLWLWALL